MITVFPRRDEAWVDAAAEAEMQLVQGVAVACRMLRATYGVPPSQHVSVELRAAGEARVLVERHLPLIERSAKITATVAEGGGPVPGAAKALVGADIEVVMPLGGLIDAAAEQQRIAKDIGKVEKEISTLEKKLANADFLARAPEDVVEEQRGRLAEEQTRRGRLVEALATLQASGGSGGPSGPSGSPAGGAS
jgi:valyl-tRNA synthetase